MASLDVIVLPLLSRLLLVHDFCLFELMFIFVFENVWDVLADNFIFDQKSQGSQLNTLFLKLNNCIFVVFDACRS